MISHCSSFISHSTSDTRHPLLVIALLTTLFITSCSQTFDTKKEMWEYLNDEANGYKYSKNINGVDYTLVYKPTDLLVDQEISDQSRAVEVDSLRKKYAPYLYFNLSMSKNNKELLSNVAGNRQQFGAMVNELAFGMDQKVHFYTPQKDTVEIADYIYPRMYGMSGTTTILLVYPKEQKVINQEFMTLSIEDLGFYTGEVKFKVSTKVFKNELGLTFSKKD